MADKSKVPAFDEMMNELLQAIKDLGGSGTIREIDKKTIEILELSPATLDIMHPKTSKTEIEYRLAWARTYLKIYGLLENSTRGIWSLSPQGRAIKEVNPAEIVREVRQNQKDRGRLDDSINLEDEDLKNDGVEAPEEIQSWREKLKMVLYKLKPDAFERLTQRILRESGFTQIEVLGKTGDGGIDGIGIVKLNGIVSFQMLFQCKRYIKDRKVSNNEIRDFRGAMQGRTDKGLFITTGKFSVPAIQEANRPGTPSIDLIDGDDLVEKLRELQLGVYPVNDYRIDENWFLSI